MTILPFLVIRFAAAAASLLIAAMPGLSTAIGSSAWRLPAIDRGIDRG